MLKAFYAFNLKFFFLFFILLWIFFPTLFSIWTIWIRASSISNDFPYSIQKENLGSASVEKNMQSVWLKLIYFITQLFYFISEYSIPIAHAGHMKEKYFNIQNLLQKIYYEVHQWSTHVDLDVIALLTGLQKGFTKNSVVSYVNGTSEHECKRNSRIKEGTFVWSKKPISWFNF